MTDPNAMFGRELWEKYEEQAREIRKKFRQPDMLKAQMELRIKLHHNGWYEIPEPEEGENEAIVHISDVETSINGFVMHDSVVFDPGEDNIRIYLKWYLTFEEFLQALRTEFDKLVKEWYPE